MNDSPRFPGRRGADTVLFRSTTVAGAERIEARLPGMTTAAGHVELSFEAGSARLANLRVAAEYRRQGLGTSLVQRAVQSAGARGLPVHLEASPSPDGVPTSTLRQMYRKLGFQDAGFSGAGILQMRTRLAMRQASGSIQPKTGPAFQPKGAPPAYRPFATVQQTPRTMAAPPPVYRPAAFLQQRPQAAASAPPVYRPAAGKTPGSLQQAPAPAFRTAPPLPVPFPGTIQRAEDRYNTMYTHMLTKPYNQLTGTPQGPHTVSHVVVSHGIQQAVSGNSWQELQDLFDQQVPYPEDVQAILMSEITVNNRQRFAEHLSRYMLEYNVLFADVFQGLDEENDADFDSILAAIRALMEMHPYQTYAWKTGKPASKKSTKGKSEAQHIKALRGGDKRSLSGLIDVSRAKFVQNKAFLDFVRTRLRLVATDVEIDQIIN